MKRLDETSPSNRFSSQIISACTGAVLTSLSMTPFDVVKNRMQAEYMNSSEKTFRAMKIIAQKEGITSLWRGLVPTLIISVPQTALYFVIYERLKDGLVHRLFPEIYSPAIAGIIARSCAVTITNPIELVRTRVQAGASDLKTVIRSVRQLLYETGPTILLRGLGPTLGRDVPFSAIYWSCIEAFKSQGRILMPERTYTQELGISFFAGSVSGVIAATCTHPFDVVKTIHQVASTNQLQSKSVWAHIYQTKGISGFWAGLAPRIVKAAPACGIMISTYEIGKRYLGDQRKKEISN